MKKLLISLLLLVPILLRARDGDVRVYSGTSTYISDVVCTVREGRDGRESRVYRGTSSYTSDVLFTIRDDRVYAGTSSYTSDVVCTVRNGRVYAGNSSYTSDVLFTVSGSLSMEEFVGLLLLLQLREM